MHFHAKYNEDRRGRSNHTMLVLPDDRENYGDRWIGINAGLKGPPKQPVTLHIDSDVLVRAKSQGQGYQTRINKLLRAYIESQRIRKTLIKF